jgi:hypothetical protein
MVFHALQEAGKPNTFTRGRSVWDYLFNDGGLNLGSAQNIVVEHHLSSGKQKVYLNGLMKKFHVVPRLKGMIGNILTEKPIPITYTSLMGCARNITEVGGYKYISLSKNVDGTGGGHAVAAWCDGRDVLFMDPNYGEFWLPTRSAFSAWFTFFWLNTYIRSYKAMTVSNYILE